jgi:amino acid permease
MNDMKDLPSQEEVTRSANWGFITIIATVVAVCVPIGLLMLVPGLPVAALMVIFGVLVIPVFVACVISFRHAVRSMKLRRAERREGRIIYTNRVGAFMDQHSYLLAFVIIGGSLLIALVWTLLENK